MRSLEKLLGLLAVIALCLGSGFVVLLAGNPIFWQISWGIFAVLSSDLVATNRRAVGHFLFHRTTRYGANLFVIALLALGIAAAVNYIGVNYNKRFDLTSSRRFTLSEQTKKVLAPPTAPVKFFFFYRPGPERPEARRRLEMLNRESKLVSAEVFHIN